MSKFKTGATFTQDILSMFITAVEAFGNSEEHPDTAFRHVTHALQKFLAYGMSRFSVETLQSVIDDLLISNKCDGEDQLSIRSLTQLRAVVKMTMLRRDTGSLKASDANALKYIETFFYCVYCMSEAKRMFDKVYENLYFAYFDPNGVSRQSTKLPSAQPRDRLLHKDGKLAEAEDYSQFGISTLQQMTGSTHHKLRQTARDMKDVLDRWSELLTDEEPNTSSFDPESEEDLHLLHGVSGTETILRLVPDLFAKYHKCMELTKQWWVLAHDVYPDVPFRKRPSRADTDAEIDFSRSSSSGGDTESLLSDNCEVTNDEIEATKVTIIENQKVINSLQEEIVALDKREDKFEILKETYEKVGNEIEKKKKEQKRFRVDRDRLNPDESKVALSVIGDRLDTLQSSIRLLEFQHALLFEDFMIHLEIRPSMIRFQDDAKWHLQEAQMTRERQMTHLQKLRDSVNSSPTTKEEVKTSKGKAVIPTIIHTTHSPTATSKSPHQTTKENQIVSEKDGSKKTRTFTVDDGKKRKNQLRNDSKEQMVDRRNQKDAHQSTAGTVVKGSTRRQSQTINEHDKAESVTKDEDASEKKINILRQANSKQNAEPINIGPNSSSKIVSKKGSDEQLPHLTTNENLRRTYDISTKSKSNPMEKHKSESKQLPQTSDKNGRGSRKVSTSTVESGGRPVPEQGQHPHRKHHTHSHTHPHIRKDNTESGRPTSPKEGKPVKSLRKSSREEATTTVPVGRPAKKPSVASKAALSVGSK